MSWEKRKLGDLCSITKGQIGITKAIPGEYPLVVTSEERKSNNEYHFEGEAVVIPLVSSTGHGHRSLKRIHYQTGKFAVGNILCAVIPNDSNILSAEYLYRFLDLNREKELVSRMRGMANVSLPIKEIAKIEIPLPPLAEQRKFVQEYKELETANNILSSEITIQLDLVKQLRQAFLREAMQGKLVKQNEADEPATELLAKIKAEKEQLIKEKKIKNQKPLPPISEDEIPFEIPESWVWCRFGEIINLILGGGTPSKANSDFWNGNVNWASVKDLNTKYLLDTKDKITELAIRKSSTNLIPKGNVIICTRMGLGKIVINQIDTTINQDLKALFFSEFIDKEYFYNFYKTLEIIGKGMTVSGIRLEELLMFNFPLPPLSEQKRIVNKLDELTAYCDNLEGSIKNSQTQNEMLLGQVLREALKPEEKEVVA
jgi:type I restriction enzyme S subunit